MPGGVELASGFVTLVPTMDGFIGKVRKELEPGLDSVSDSTGKKMGGKLSAGLAAGAKAGLAALGGLTVAAGAAFGKLALESFKAAGSLEQNLGGSEAVFGEFATAIQEKGAQAFDKLGLSQSAYLATANKMGSLFQGAGFDQSAALDLTSSAMQRAADVASIMGIDIDSAMESIAGAAKGNFTMMDNLGVAMNETQLNAYALEKGIGKTTAQMTQQEKIGLAMEMFLDKTAYAAENYAKENETLAGSMQTAKAAFENFLSGSGTPEQLSNALVNVGNVIVDMAGTLLPNLVTGVTSVLTTMIPKITGIMSELAPVVVEGIVGMTEAITQSAPALAEAFIPALMGMINSLIQMLPLLLDAGLQILTALLSGIAQALPTIIPTIVTVIQQMVIVLIENLPLILEAGLQLLIGLVEGILQAIPQMTAQLPMIINALVSFFTESIPMIINTGIELLLALVENLPTIINGIVAAIPQIIDALVNFFTGPALPSIIDAGVKLFVALVENLPTIITMLNGVIPQIITAIVGTFGKALPRMAEAGKNLIQGLINGLGNAAGAVVRKIQEICSGALDAVKNFFGIKSPSKVMSEMGVYLMEGLSGGIEKTGSRALGAMASVMDDLLGVTNAVTPTIAVKANAALGAIAADNTFRSRSLQTARFAQGSTQTINYYTIGDVSYTPDSKIAQLMDDLFTEVFRVKRMGMR